MAKDPVCGAEIDEQDATQAGLRSDYLNRSFCFCSEKCKTRFDSEPGAFAGQYNDWEEWDIPDQIFPR